MLIKPKKKFITRRLLLGALAAPAIIAARHADAAFGRFMASSTQSGTSGLVKPNGTPTMIDNALSAGMLNYVFDTGTGLYALVKDCSPAHALDPIAYYSGSPNYAPGSTPFDPKQSLALPTSTPYGDAIAWSSGLDSQTPGGGCVMQLASVDDLRTSINLAARGSGAGCTMFATHRTTGQNRFGTIYSRFANMDALAYVCGIGSSNNINTDYSLFFGWSAASDNSSPQFLGTNSQFGIGVLTSTVVSMLNTSAGVTRIRIYVNAVLEADLSNQTVRDLTAAVAFGEDQLQIGTGFHVYAGQSYNSYDGNVYQAGTADRAWSEADAISFAANPYQLLNF